MIIAFLRKYFGRLYISIIWTIIIAVLCCMPGSMIPNEGGFAIPNFDKIVHAGIFGGFAFLWNLYLSNKIFDTKILLRLFFLTFILANAYGIGMELVQKCCIPNRDYDLDDIIADMIGAGIFYGLSNILLL
ncbi:MAG: VanZ family protein, partial [Bacteroidetes bacterium]|nr:VanZ family protein [Bacteroidota bacterium]